MPRFVFDAERSHVWIDGSSSVHPIRATASGVTGWIEVATIKAGIAAKPTLSGEVRIEIDRLQSGNPLVDRETRRRVDARNHPEIVGTVSAATRIDPTQVAITGDLAFRGETREVDGTVTIAVDDGTITIDGVARFDVREWGLEPPRVALLRVHPHVAVRIHLVGRAESL